MKTTIKYIETFSIPKDLPHQFVAGESEIFGDSITVVGEILILLSHCGATNFRRWEETEDKFIIPAGAWAQYEGAYASINSVVGIKFGECTIGAVESNYGNFKTLEGYQLARRAVSFAQLADANNSTVKASSSFDKVADRLGNLLN